MAGYVPSAKTVEHRTPARIVELVRQTFHGEIDLDPCATEDRGYWFANRNVCLPDNGLLVPWYGRVYVNPPFDTLGEWCGKAAYSRHILGAEVMVLMPARTDTAYWHQYVTQAQAVCFLRGRLRFGDATASCPFPVALAYWGRAPWGFHEIWGKEGMVVTP